MKSLKDIIYTLKNNYTFKKNPSHFPPKQTLLLFAGSKQQHKKKGIKSCD
jgi:hypothetical protein